MQQNLLARLMGEGPDATQNLFAGERVSIPARISLPPRLPIELLAHRPDLAAAMYRAEASAKRIHVAKAQFLPSVDLTVATAGLEASVFTENIATLPGLLFRGSDLNYLVAPGFHLPLFEGGRLRGQLLAARSQYDEAVELYNDTLLHAVQEVADELEGDSVHTRKRSAIQIREQRADSDNVACLAAPEIRLVYTDENPGALL